MHLCADDCICEYTGGYLDDNVNVEFMDRVAVANAGRAGLRGQCRWTASVGAVCLVRLWIRLLSHESVLGADLHQLRQVRRRKRVVLEAEAFCVPLQLGKA